jgi:hypothetical protein
MRPLSEAVVIADLEDRAISSSARARRRPQRDLSAIARGFWETLEPWRGVVPTAFLTLWIGLSLVPSLHPLLRAPMTVLLAALIGAGTQLCLRTPGPVQLPRVIGYTVWIVPTGATIAAVVLLAGVGSRLASLTPLLAGAIVGAIVLQSLEARGTRGLLSWTRPVNAGLAFASAAVGFACAPGLAPGFVLGLAALSGALVALVVLRASRPSPLELVTYVGLTALAMVGLGLVASDMRPIFVAAGVPLLALYAITTTTQAFLERAPRRAYLEVAIVTGAALTLAAFVLNRP